MLTSNHVVCSAPLILPVMQAL